MNWLGQMWVGAKHLLKELIRRSDKNHANASPAIDVLTYIRSAIVEQISTEANKTAHVSGSIAGVGVVAGVGVASFAPTAAIAIATTFGTASTGTAISALSGAAAANAALAWLGGGALAAGGGGIAAGNALLALAGPVGWAIGGTALLGGALWTRKNNAEIAQKANEEIKKIQGNIATLQAAKEEITQLLNLTQQYADSIHRRLNLLQIEAPNNYKYFSNQQKLELTTLIKDIDELSQLLNKKLS